MAAELCCFSPSIVVFVTFLLTVSQVGATVCPPHCTCLFPMVECSKKGLTTIPENLPDWVEILELSSNKISTIADGALSGLPNLVELDLSDNELTSLPESVFYSLPNLKTLKLSFNKLDHIPVPPRTNNISQIILHHNQIERINGEALVNLPRLRVLNLNFNQLRELRVGTFPAENSLRQLLLNNNNIQYIERDALSHLQSLEWLKLNKNGLRNLTKNMFGELKRLRNLELSRNKFQRIEGLALKDLKNLLSLTLKNNHITDMMDGAFFGLSKMQTLELDHNNISAVTKNWLYGLSELQQLSLSHNQISSIDPDSWEVCDNELWELNLESNRMSSISADTFKGLANLEYLYLNNNKISYVEEGAFKDLGAVKTLEMGHNQLSWTVDDMDGAFEGLVSLSRLGLISNHIKVISNGAFLGLDHLRHLLLTDNAISSIKDNAFALLSQLEELQLNSTNLLCDCQLSWLPVWLRTAGFAASVKATCAHPESLKGRSIFDVKKQNFTCNSSDVPQPVIVSEPESPQIALRGGNLSLQCVAQSTTDLPVEVIWKKDNRLIIPNPNLKVVTYASTDDGSLTKFTSSLSLSNIKDGDAGKYQCVANNSLGSSSSKRIDIQVHVFPTFTKTPENITARARSRARLECAATGHPDPQISWQKDGGDDFPAARERRMQVLPGDAVFFILNVSSGDQGVYSCTATNAAGTIMVNATLTVLETPTFLQPMESKTTAQDESTVFQCMASGSPEPTIAWYKDGNPLTLTDRHFFTAQDQLLIIINTQPSDAGKYTCEMQNTLGIEKGTSELTVVPREPKGSMLDDDSTTTGIIIIAVVCCVVGTSLIWVIIIYQTRKKSEEYSSTPTDDTTLPGEVGEMGYHGGEMYLSHLGYGKYPTLDMNGGCGMAPSKLRSAAIFPSDIEDHPLMGEHHNGDMSECSLGSRLPGSDNDMGGHSSSSPSTYSSHSTQSTTLLHTFHPQPSSQTLYASHDFDDPDSPQRLCILHAIPPGEQESGAAGGGGAACRAPHGSHNQPLPDSYHGSRPSGHPEEAPPGEAGEYSNEAASACECPSATFPRTTRSPALSRGRHHPHNSLPRLPKEYPKDSITTSSSSSSSSQSSSSPHSSSPMECSASASASFSPSQSNCACAPGDKDSCPHVDSYRRPPPPVPPHRTHSSNNNNNNVYSHHHHNHPHHHHHNQSQQKPPPQQQQRLHQHQETDISSPTTKTPKHHTRAHKPLPPLPGQGIPQSDSLPNAAARSRT